MEVKGGKSSPANVVMRAPGLNSAVIPLSCMLRVSGGSPGVAACADADRNGGWASRAQVAERLMAADCKSAAPCELRRFESSPVHHFRDQVSGVREQLARRERIGEKLTRNEWNCEL